MFDKCCVRVAYLKYNFLKYGSSRYRWLTLKGIAGSRVWVGWSRLGAGVGEQENACLIF